MRRIEMPAEEAMTPEQRQACAEVIAGKRGKVPAPMIAWIRNPELARRIQSLGETLRYETSLGPRLTELAVLVCARHWTAHPQWKAHKAYALRAGLEPAIVEAIAARAEPAFDDDKARLVYRVCAALLKTGRVDDALYREAVAALGEPGLTELVALLGYYCLASFTLNTFRLGLPEAVAPELADPEFATEKGSA